MIVGNGMLARAFRKEFDSPSAVIFASGVSNSAEERESEYEKEKALLLQTAKACKGAAIVYFSSCALVDDVSLNNRYYRHKKEMEELVAGLNKYIILRLPQVIGNSDNPHTILNAFILAIKKGKKLSLQKDAFRYFIGLSDITLFVRALIENGYSNLKIDLANPYRYSAKSIADIIAFKIGVDNYPFELIDGGHGYKLELDEMHALIDKLEIKLSLCESYLENKVSEMLT